MKKILTMIFIFSLICFLVSCINDEKKVAILIYDQEDTFMKEYLDEIILNLDGKIKYDVSYANRSQAIQNRQFNEYIEQSYDLFIINAVDRLASQTLIDKSNQLNIPIIFINREPVKDEHNNISTYYVGADSIGMGLLQSDMIYNDFKDNKIIDKNQDAIIQTAILKGEQGHQDAENRTKMVIEGLESLGMDIQVLEIKVANWDRLQAYTYMKQFLENFETIELVISNNDDMALGALDYINELNNLNNEKLSIPIYGVDATKQGIEAYEAGLLYGTIVNDYIKQARLISEYVKYLLFNEKVEGIDYSIKFNYVEGYIYQ